MFYYFKVSLFCHEIIFPGFLYPYINIVYSIIFDGSLRGLVANVLKCDIKVFEFEP